nr:hypothetical protein [Clostridia bacterium]
MSYVGKWVFHSIGMMNEIDEIVYLSGEEYLKAPIPPYVDESDEEAVADEMKERQQTVGGKIAVCEDGNLYMLMPLPDGVSKEEVDEAVKAGHIKLYDGMITDEPKKWEERDGELWLEVGEGMSEDGWVKLSEDGLLAFITTRYEKVQ